MSKLIPLALALACAAGCDGQWFQPCSQTTDKYCTEDGSSGPCDEGGTLYYVWHLEAGCAGRETSFCAGSDPAQAQQMADQQWGSTPHGSVTTFEGATAPKEHTFCPTGSCQIGSEDGSTGTTFDTFDDSQIQGCEDQYDPQRACVWNESDNGTCGGTL